VTTYPLTPSPSDTPIITSSSLTILRFNWRDILTTLSLLISMSQHHHQPSKPANPSMRRRESARSSHSPDANFAEVALPPSLSLCLPYSSLERSRPLLLLVQKDLSRPHPSKDLGRNLCFESIAL
jgi:hypothetical protein